MRKGAKVVFEYKTKQYADGNRVISWNQWNLQVYPDKKVFAVNVPPTVEMNVSLFDADGVPCFILNSDGTYAKSLLAESEKIKLPEVIKKRFFSDYPQVRLNTILLSALDNKDDPEFLEYKRRKAEFEIINALKK